MRNDGDTKKEENGTSADDQLILMEGRSTRYTYLVYLATLLQLVAALVAQISLVRLELAVIKYGCKCRKYTYHFATSSATPVTVTASDYEP